MLSRNNSWTSFTSGQPSSLQRALLVSFNLFVCICVCMRACNVPGHMLILLLTALYFTFFFCCFDFSVAFHFQSCSTCYSAFNAAVWKTLDGGTPTAFCHASGPQDGPMLHHSSAPAQ